MRFPRCFFGKNTGRPNRSIRAKRARRDCNREGRRPQSVPPGPNQPRFGSRPVFCTFHSDCRKGGTAAVLRSGIPTACRRNRGRPAQAKCPDSNREKHLQYSVSVGSRCRERFFLVPPVLRRFARPPQCRRVGLAYLPEHLPPLVPEDPVLHMSLTYLSVHDILFSIHRKLIYWEAT